MFTFFKRNKVDQADHAASESPMEPGIDGDLLDAHLCAIRVCLMEVLHYKKKRMAPTPTHIYWKMIDTEEAWESSKELMLSAFRTLCIVAAELHVPHEDLSLGSNFKQALCACIDMIEKIDRHILDTTETTQLSESKLVAIDAKILEVQHATNRVNRHVIKEFTYS